jgi:hypothetical protein
MTDELEAIRARHEAVREALDDEAYYSGQVGQKVLPNDACRHAHTDRATLLRLLDAAREELAEERAKISAWTDDDQRNLNAAVADAMWHWDTRDEGPLDPDDALSLTEALKIHLQDNGFQIVRLATRAQGESS